MIYFAQDSGTFEIKIGFSDTMKGVEKRLEAHQVGNPRKIQLLFVIHGDQEKEQNIHHSLSAHCVRGEWFRPHPDVMRYIIGFFADNLEDNDNFIFDADLTISWQIKNSRPAALKHRGY